MRNGPGNAMGQFRMRTLRKLAVCLSAAALVLLSSCVPVLSMHPFFTEKDLTFDPHLLGTWFDPADKDSQGTITFERVAEDGHDAYSITLADPSKKPVEKDTFEAHLFNLDGHLFLDVVQTKVYAGDDDLLVLEVPAHMLGRVSFDGDVLNLTFLNDDWVRKNLENGKFSVRHESGDDGTPLLTASTSELQRFALDHVSDNEAFSVDVKNLHRKK